MKTFLFAIVIGTCFAAFLPSCTYDKEIIIPESICPDTLNTSFAARVAPLLRANCFSCHGNGSAEGNVSLDSYDEIKAIAASGRLLGSISHAPGFAAMPDGGDKLDDCSINIVRRWIAEGTKDN